MVKKIVDIFTRFDRIHERDGHTDRQTPHDNIGLHSITRKNNANIRYPQPFPKRVVMYKGCEKIAIFDQNLALSYVGLVSFARHSEISTRMRSIELCHFQ